MLMSDHLSQAERTHLRRLVQVHRKDPRFTPTEGELADLAVAGTLVPGERRALDSVEELREDQLGAAVVHMHGDAGWCAALLAQVVAHRGAVVARQLVGPVVLAAFVMRERSFTEVRLDDAGLVELADQSKHLADCEDECARLTGEFEGAKAVAELVATVFAEHRAAARSVVNRTLLGERNPLVLHAVHTGSVLGVYVDPTVAALAAKQAGAALASVSVYVPGVLVDADEAAAELAQELIVDPDLAEGS